MNNTGLCSISEPSVMRENYPKPLDGVWHLDLYEVLKVLLMGSVVLVSVMGNLMVMVVVYVNNFLHSTINYYLVNLAVADLLITAFCWPTIVNRITTPLYLLGRAMCRISVLTQATCVTVSVLTLAVVACDRVYAVLLPIRARSASSRPLTLIIILWLFSFAISFPFHPVVSFLTLASYSNQWNDLLEESCGDVLFSCNPSYRSVFNFYKIMLMVTLFFVPVVVMTLAYTIIIFRLWCVRRGPLTDLASTPEPHINARRKIVRMTATVLLTFTICWLPLHALSIYDLTVDPIDNYALPGWFEPALFWAYFLGYSNSALNPILYGGFSENFRLGFRKLLGRRQTASGFLGGNGSRTASTYFTRNNASRKTSDSLSRQTSNSLSRKISNSLSRQISNTVPQLTSNTDTQQTSDTISH
ncbi:5-hydroxytryptamine receptor 1B-like [Homarus americanus]|uniref:5-hydroxytryptamine receptor 1B-like n=1 Tax=Homarus americanus TaxID=6706 RepID=UPI001C4746B3|nr:5-hydroxytryptamine receptor 1B-like [Homarus americanus]